MKDSEVRAVAFFNEDLDLIDPKWTVGGVGRGWFTEGPSITILIGDKVAGALGIAPIYPGVGIAWCLMDKAVPVKHSRRIALLCKEELERKMKHFSFHRVQADVAFDFKEGIRFVEFLGFEHEGTMRAFGPEKKDYIRYATVRV